jgi:hypothetical protein
MTMYHHQGPSQARPKGEPAAGLTSEVRQRSANALASLEDECLDDPNLQRIDAFLANDQLEEPGSEEV